MARQARDKNDPVQDLNEYILELLKRIAAKEEGSMEEFFELYSDIIYNFPIRFYNFTEDEAGDFYLYAFEHIKDGKKLSSFAGKSKFSTWFYSVLRNLTIDFLRTQKEKIKTTTFLKMDARGNLVDAIENVSDEAKQSSFEDELFENFVKHLISLKLPQRVLFKLAYIHYIDLDDEEIEWLCEKNGLKHAEVVRHSMRLKEIALKKEGEVRGLEDKLTANFQQISVLEGKLNSFFQDNPHLDQDRDRWSDDYENSEFPLQIGELVITLSKKKKKHLNLLVQQKKGLLSVRVPYKEIAELMDSSKGVLSVQLLRIIEKLNQAMQSSPEG